MEQEKKECEKCGIDHDTNSKLCIPCMDKVLWPEGKPVNEIQETMKKYLT